MTDFIKESLESFFAFLENNTVGKISNINYYSNSDFDITEKLEIEFYLDCINLKADNRITTIIFKEITHSDVDERKFTFYFGEYSRIHLEIAGLYSDIFPENKIIDYTDI